MANTELENRDLLIGMYRKASRKFIKKVETGLARSTETYADLQECERATEMLYGPPKVEEADGGS